MEGGAGEGEAARQRLARIAQKRPGVLLRGRVGRLVAGVGRSSGAIDEAQFAVVIFMVVLTTLLAPLLLKPIILWAEGGRLPAEEA